MAKQPTTEIKLEKGKDEDWVHPELRNLVDELEDDELLKIGARCLANFKSDLDSRSEWEEMHASWLKLYFQKDKPTNPPWEGASEESIPMLVEACHQFTSRAYQAMFPSRKFVSCMPTGKSDGDARARSKRIATHMSWQLSVKDRRYKRNKDRLLTGLPLHGSVFTKTYYCPVRAQNIVENIRAVDLVVPYGSGPRDISEVERKTHIIRMPLVKAENLVESGFLAEAPKSYGGGDNGPVDDAHDDVEGNTEPLDASIAHLLEQHCYLDLDDDGKHEPYIVTLDRNDGKVLRLSVGYETDERGMPTNKKEPIEYFTHYPFMENPDGFYGLGFGHMIGPINTAVNKLIRQTIDAGTLSNVGNQSGFISQTLSAGKGDMRMQLGKFIAVPNSAEDISRAVFQFKFPGPNAALHNVAMMLMQRGDRLATVTEAVTGQVDKVMQPTTVLALIEQSMQVYSAVYERLLDSWEMELAKIFRLNGKFLDPEEYFAVLDVTGELQEEKVARSDYDADMQVKPIADPKMTTEKQKLTRSDAEWQFAMSNPLIANSPQHLYNASKRWLTAIGSEAIDEVLPKPQGKMPRVDDPTKENMGALSPAPMVPPAWPDQNHLEHMKTHQALLFDPEYGKTMSDLGRQMLEEHVQAHVAMMYGSTEVGPGPEPVGLEAPAGNATLLEEDGGGIPFDMGGSFDMGGGQPS